jgi:hypothetical protein
MSPQITKMYKAELSDTGETLRLDGIRACRLD